MSTPVGIVVRARGARPLLDRALRSVLAQTHADWRAVVVGAVPADLVTNTVDERVTFLAQPDAAPADIANAGFAAIAAAEPTYVALHDDDATWHPAFLERALGHLDANPDHIAVAARVEVVVETHDETGIHELSREALARDTHEASLVELTWGNYLPASSLVMRESARARVGGFDTELSALEDWDFVLRLLALGSVGFLADAPLASWHHGPDVPDRDDAELLVRDRFVRRDLARGESGLTGLGVQLGIAHQLRGLGAKTDSAWNELSRVVDTWGHAHTDHLDAVRTEMRLELGRLRGEMLLIREILTDIEEDVSALSDTFDDALRKNRRSTEVLLRRLLERVESAEASRWTVRRVARGVRRRLPSRARGVPEVESPGPGPAKPRALAPQGSGNRAEGGRTV